MDKNSGILVDKEKYYEYQKAEILKLKNEGSLFWARKMILEGLEIFPNDYQLLRLLADTCIEQRDYLGAIQILESLDEQKEHNLLTSLYVKVKDKVKLEEFYEKYYSTPLYADQDVHDYSDDEFLDYQLHLYITQLFNFRFNLNWGDLVYICKQIYSYDQRSALSHIKHYHQKEDRKYKGLFDPSISINQLLNQVRNYIENNQGQGIFEYPLKDSYCFYYKSCGKKRKGKSTDYFEVISLVNTANIITMYPVSFNEKLTIHFLEDKTETNKFVKVKSGLERFNARYSQR